MAEGRKEGRKEEMKKIAECLHLPRRKREREREREREGSSSNKTTGVPPSPPPSQRNQHVKRRSANILTLLYYCSSSTVKLGKSTIFSIIVSRVSFEWL